MPGFWQRRPGREASGESSTRAGSHVSSVSEIPPSGRTVARVVPAVEERAPVPGLVTWSLDQITQRRVYSMLYANTDTDIEAGFDRDRYVTS